MSAAGGPIFDVQFSGFPQVEKNFKALPLFVQRKYLRGAMRDGAKVMLTHVRAAAAAVSPGRGGKGRLASSIRVKAMKRSRARGGRIGFVVITGRRGELGIRGDDPGYYPAHLEYGYRTGRRVQGPVRFEMTRRGESGRFEAKSMTAARARAELQSGRRKKPGLHWMRNALRAGEASAREEVARSLERRMREDLEIDQAAFDREVSVAFEEDFVFGGETGL